MGGQSNDVELRQLSPRRAADRANHNSFTLFERAARSWWDPRFDSTLLERQLQESSFPSVRRQFQYALIYILIAAVLWAVFFAVNGYSVGGGKWTVLVGCSAAVAVIVLILLLVTKLLKNFSIKAHRLCAVILLTILVVSVACIPLVRSGAPYDEMTDVALFAAVAELLLLMYTILPLPLYLCTLLGVVMSIMSEVVLLTRPIAQLYTSSEVVIRALLHLALHIIGVHLFLMAQVRRHSTFLKIGQSLQLRKEHEFEMQMQERMLHSLMPPSFAKDVLKIWSKFGKERGRASPFPVSHMKNVSILFADIVGFTNMSSDKTAERLVELLNELFGRFDKICTRMGCEKICTLGDCYYSVAGCPEAKEDHAQCCVELGLGMIRAIIEFDKDFKEEVQMRVGVHTGAVLFGIVGSSRFKFDVWSNDVTLANTMESTGQAARVHISHDTLEFVKDIYTVEEGEEIQDPRVNKNTLKEGYDVDNRCYIVHHEQKERTIKTYFITGRIGEEPLDPQKNLDAFPPTEVKQVSDVDITLTNDDESGHSDVEDTAATAPLRPKDRSTPRAQLVMKENLTEVMVKRDHTTNTDREKNLIRCIRQVGSQEYFYKPPVNRFTLCFNTAEEEHKYQHQYMQGHKASTSTLAHPRVVAFVDSIVSILMITLVSVCCFILGQPVHVALIVTFVVALLVNALIVVFLALDVFKDKQWLHLETYAARHVVGCVLLLLPAAAVFVLIGTMDLPTSWHLTVIQNLMLVITLLNFCTFTQLSLWVKGVLATVCAIIRVVLMSVYNKCPVDVLDNNLTNTTPAQSNGTDVDSGLGCFLQRYEIFWDIGLLLMLIWAVNREFEIISRLGFHGDDESEKDKEKMLTAKNEAERLLHNIIPMHVAETLKGMSKYSQQHTNVGVVFATITNFNDFYDEHYKDGKEFLRVLNEIFWDFEEEIKKPEFKDVEKIKTISSCFMVASGLDTQLRAQNKNPDTHLYALLLYCIQLLSILSDFNASMFEFDFHMNIGFNNGEVVAGVIGTTKLLFDIWGDAVNIASRMYSTGVQGRIQVLDKVKDLMGDKFEFEERGKVTVKGKGVMDTFLVVRMKPGATWE